MLRAEVQQKQLPQIEGIKGSEAFRLEYAPNTPERAIWNDVVSYLGEYRFQVQKYQYTLFYAQGEDGLHIRGEEKGRALLDVGEKGIEDRQARGEVTKKVVADYLGMQKMEELVAYAKDGDTIMYASPADPEMGYSYGFFYIGKVAQRQGKEKQLDMTAVRLDSQQELDRYNTAIRLLTGNTESFATVNEFIANPRLVRRNISSLEVDFVLKGIFDFLMDKKRQERFAGAIGTMTPYIMEFIDLIKTSASSIELQTAFNALENYVEILQNPDKTSSLTVSSLARRDGYAPPEEKHHPNNLGILMRAYGHEPKKVTGTCGPTSKNKLGGSADVFGQNSLFAGEVLKAFSLNDENEDKSEGFECPNCHIGWVRGDTCSHCKITAQEWADKVGAESACV